MRFLFPLSAVVPFLTISPISADTIYVNADRSEIANGTSWETAFASLQDALDLAATTPSADEIWVARGTYRPERRVPLGSPDSRTATFQLVSGVAIYGGFLGNETSRDAANPDPTTNGTVLSGDLIGNDSDFAFSLSDNCYHVVTGTGTDSTAVLSGFTIRAGNADGASANRHHLGGGLLCDFSGNPSLSNLLITGNRAAGVGGAAYLNEGSPTFTNVIFSNNQTPVTGTGVTGEGGAVYHNLSDATYINCLFSGNRAASNGGAVSLHGGNPTFANCTFSGNASGSGGGGFYAFDISPTLHNCIVWGNTDVSGAPEFFGTLIGSNNLIQGGSISAIITQNTDPLFASAPAASEAPTAAGDFRINSGSPAIDTGNLDAFNTASGNLASDLYGNNRMRGATIDLGALEAFDSANISSQADGVIGSLRVAIKGISDGGRITFAPSLSGQTLTLSGQSLEINNDLVIDGSTLADPLTIDAGGNSRVFEIGPEASASIRGLVISGGNVGGTGGGIFSQGKLILNGVLLHDNSAGLGGGVSNEGGSLRIVDSSIINNIASVGGGIANGAGGTLTLIQSTLAQNSADTPSGGGGIWLGSGSTGSISFSTITDNTTTGPGGGILAMGGGKFSVNSSIVAGNTAGITDQNLYGTFFDAGGNVLSGDPLLAPLGTYGGDLPCRPPLEGSPALDQVERKISGPLVEGGDVQRGFLSTPAGYAVYRADAETDGVRELYSVPISGGNPIKLNSPLLENGNIIDFQPSSDGYVVYRADAETHNVFELFRVPISGGNPIKLSGPLVENGDVSEFQLSSDGHVVYLADAETENIFELYSVPISGGNPIKLNPSLPLGGDVLDFQLSSDGHVVYSADAETDNITELFSVPISGGNSIKLNGPLVENGDVSAFQLSADGHVVYRADAETHGVNELYSVPISGGTPIKLSGPRVEGGTVNRIFQLSEDGNVVYLADAETRTVNELYSVPISGGNPIKLNGPLVEFGDVLNTFQVSSDGYVVYRADAEVNGMHELYSVPISGGTPIKLNGPLVTGGNVTNNFQISSDGYVVYHADAEVNGINELYRVPTSGGSPIKLNIPLVVNGSVRDFQLSSDGHVIYLADAETDNVDELFSIPLRDTDQRGASRLLDGDGDGSPNRDSGAAERYRPFVNTTADDGDGSLRRALRFADSESAIGFDRSLAGQTITLTGGPLVPAADNTIDASSLSVPLTIDANSTSRVLEVRTGVTLSLDSLKLIGGRAFSQSNGGGILNEGTLTLDRCTLANNQTAVDPDPLEFGAPSGNGGAISNSGMLTLTRSTFADNATGNGRRGMNQVLVPFLESAGPGGKSGNGGAIFNTGDLSISRCTFTRNQTGRGGNGGSGNPAGLGGAGGSGGAVYNSGTLFIGQSTITENTAGVGGTSNLFPGFPGTAGGVFSTETLGLDNSIVTENNSGATGNPQISGGISNNGTTLLLDGDPQLLPLGNYGGPTQTMPPIASSPAINQASNTVFDTDQRGFPRVFDGAADLGAVEYQGPTDLVHILEDFNGDPDGDGFSNGLETAIGTDPFVVDPHHPNRLRSIGFSAGEPEYSFGYNMATRFDIELRVMGSTDLVDFSDLLFIVNDVPLDQFAPDSEILGFSPDIPEPKLFLRLEASPRNP